MADKCLSTQLELEARLGLKNKALRSLIVAVRYRMMDNPYHNFFHSVDMMQVSIFLRAFAAFATRLTRTRADML